MAEANRAETIRRIFAAYLANDRTFVENALSDDFRFTSPYDDNIDKPTYFDRCWKGRDWIERHELERIFVQGDEAFVTYRCVAKGGRDFRNTEFFGLRASPDNASHRRANHEGPDLARGASFETARTRLLRMRSEYAARPLKLDPK